MANPIVTHLLRAQILGLWGRGDISLVAQNYAPAVVDHMPVAGQAVGRGALAEVVTEFRRDIHGLTMTLHGTITCGNMGVDFWTLTGSHGDKPLSFSGIDMVRVADGQITDIWHVEEMLQYADQIGATTTIFGAPVTAAPDVTTAVDHDPGRLALVPANTSMSALERRNLAIARDHIENIWARGDMSAAYRLYARDVIDHQPAPGQRAGIGGIVDVLGWLREAVPDLRMDIMAYVVEDDLAADRWVMRGTHTGAPLMGIEAAGRSFAINGMDVIRIREDGLITDVWHVEEFARLRNQISV